MSSAAVTAAPPVLTLATRAGRWVLVATVLGSALAAIDATVVGIALPAIGEDFHTSLTLLQWVITAYMLTLAGLLLVAGAAGDHYGRRRVFTIGVIWFAAASLLCGLAPNAPALIVARALQGVGAALLTPGSLAILQASFRQEDRGKAIGAWSGLGGVATAAGPLLGGWLVQAVSWRLIFYINLPLAAAVMIISARHVPESRDPGARGRLDFGGGLLVTLGLVGLTFGLIEGSVRGWTSAPVLAALAGGIAMLACFLVRERRVRAPILPLGVFRSRQFSATNAVTFVIYGALGGALFLLPVQLQQVGGFTPVQAGVTLLPVTLIMLALSARSGALAARIGPRLQMSAGPVVVAAGLALMSRIGPHASYATEVLPAVIVFGFGLALTVAPLTATALSAAPQEHVGIASAVNNDVARAAGLIAVSVLPAAAGLTAGSYLNPSAFDAGFSQAMYVAAAVCAAGGVLAALTIRNPRRPSSQPAPCMNCPLDGPALTLRTMPQPQRTARRRIARVGG